MFSKGRCSEEFCFAMDTSVGKVSVYFVSSQVATQVELVASFEQAVRKMANEHLQIHLTHSKAAAVVLFKNYGIPGSQKSLCWCCWLSSDGNYLQL